MTPFPIRLQTQVWNSLGDRRALLLHGIGADGGTMWRVASFLAQHGWIAVAPDLRSHGRSPSAEDHRVDAYAADVALLGDHWDLVVGHSFGGTIAAHLLTSGGSAPTVLIDPLLSLDAGGAERVRERLRAMCGQVETGQLQASFPLWDDRDVYRRQLAAAQITPDVIDAIIDANVPLFLGEAPASWTPNVMVLAADSQRGGTVTETDIAALHRSSNVTVVSVDAGHSIHCDKPSAVFDVLRQIANL